MISDPVFVGSDTHLLRPYVGTELFMMSKKKLRYALVIEDRKNLTFRDYWMINVSGAGNPWYVMPSINAGYASIKAGAFFDELKERYPQHFEWILFHPEWLP